VKIPHTFQLFPEIVEITPEFVETLPHLSKYRIYYTPICRNIAPEMSKHNPGNVEKFPLFVENINFNIQYINKLRAYKYSI